MVVRRAVTLGLPVNLVAQESATSDGDNVVGDYRKLAAELIHHGDAFYPSGNRMIFLKNLLNASINRWSYSRSVSTSLH